MHNCILEGFTHGTLDATLIIPNGVFEDAKVRSKCGKVSIDVNVFTARDRLECAEEGKAVFYYD